MKQRYSISEPPINKLEQLRQKFQKQLTKVNTKGYVDCGLGKLIQNDVGSRISVIKNSFLEKLQSINSSEEDERNLLKSIQFDVKHAIQRYQQRIESIAQLQVQRNSMRSCSKELVQYFTTPQQDKYFQFDAQEQSMRSQYDSHKPNEIISISKDQIKQKKDILTNKKSDKTFKIIQAKKKQVGPVKKKQNDQSLTGISILKNQSLNKDRTISQKSTRQPSVKEISLNLEQRRSTDRLSKHYNTSRQRNSVLSSHYNQNIKPIQ
ncbi:unnamed protein product [Paramecium octaurelia]|uniref:Uncharacterized protein n=1 Tax=Paramecium octaurelia TaxID=43137 RepID=A0A8S1V8J8_PAROT|nr:unnamed protein product [Paramecium octaurelia]